jgi:hypothetical protein
MSNRYEGTAGDQKITVNKKFRNSHACLTREAEERWVQMPIRQKDDPCLTNKKRVLQLLQRTIFSPLRKNSFSQYIYAGTYCVAFLSQTEAEPFKILIAYIL